MSTGKWLQAVKTFVDENLRRLAQCTLDISGRIVDASNATLLASASFEGQEFQCIYKPEAGERPLWDFPSGSLAQREYATFLFSYLMQDYLVPPTVLREGPFGRGMVQLWIDVDENVDLMDYFQEDNEQLRRLALFDAVVNNTDRKIGHLLPRKDGRLFACDHGVTFHEDDKLRTVLWQWADQPLTTQEGAWLEKARDVANDLRFSELINREEISALKQRIKRLIDSNKFPSPSEEWPAVPWPPF